MDDGEKRREHESNVRRDPLNPETAAMDEIRCQYQNQRVEHERKGLVDQEADDGADGGDGESSEVAEPDECDGSHENGQIQEIVEFAVHKRHVRQEGGRGEQEGGEAALGQAAKENASKSKGGQRTGESKGGKFNSENKARREEADTRKDLAYQGATEKTVLVGGEPVRWAVGTSGEIAAEKSEAEKEGQEAEAEAGEVPIL